MFAILRRLLEARLMKHGRCKYVHMLHPGDKDPSLGTPVLRLLETFSLEEVTRAIEDALHQCTVSFDAVKHLLLCRIKQRPPRLDMENYPLLPLAQVRTTRTANYTCCCHACRQACRT